MKKEIQKILEEAIRALQRDKIWPVFELEKIQVDYPNDEKFGDYVSNLAMLLAKKIGKSPMEIANQIVKLLNGQIAKNPSPTLPFQKGEEKISPFEKGGLGGIFMFEKVEVANPGYINFYLSEKYLQNKIEEINSQKGNFGKNQIGQGKKINNEFISANPTGPLHLGNGRGGFYGDVVSNVLRKVGFEVINEYYVNDSGEQVIKLGHSVLKDREAVYGGVYIDELREKYKNISDIREIGEKAAKDILENIVQKTVKEKMQINFDKWTSEKKIQDDGYVDRAIDLLKEKKLTYDSGGALWLKTTQFGDDKDRVLIKSNGENAYIAGDCGYMLNKIERGFSRLIMGLGADHHGYVSRLKAVAKALDFTGDFRIVISQMVRIVKDGKEVKMSKRSGNVVYIDELIDKVGHDTARFFFLMYCPDTHMSFDLKLAEERSEKNPVFYAQYAHARICSILRKAREKGIDFTKADLTKIIQKKELKLARELDKFPELIEEIAQDYTVHKLPHYAIKLADEFHSFYNDLKVIDEDNLEVSRARLKLINAVRIVLAETLRLIGVKAPEKM
ncbi:MAG: arginine--tRNA ligase [Candidatus Moranbacteria bacterium CG_4_9_14_3_um_filter_40_7]|nr:MAG: arginine--tRNA ligase [Candidatus Moranbacteria bacterium CG23_combo_of_CG06-09_8_20_14_all_40_16]PIU80460.1 MAG: arginine--tRNA ligase [Candidatus Moranbacteria bacterium CG06_land_8_20_14_3_00_40_12]PJA88130.1 MAG: arginine--tRNA ligase [Candidatus Moranbacteria bacterium CG_4_9_14_3_um_filter_40_7]